MNPVDADEKTIYSKALALLARREHARAELKRKLQQRYTDDTLIDTVLDRLQQENYQSNTRFAEHFLRARVNQGYGALRIERELQDKGVSEDLIQQTLLDAEVDWEDHLRQVREKKFGDQPPEDFKEKSKQVKFLEYRGFALSSVLGLLGGLAG